MSLHAMAGDAMASVGLDTTGRPLECAKCGLKIVASADSPVVLFDGDAYHAACCPLVSVFPAAGTATEKVDHPSHYHKDTGVEVIDAIEAWGPGFSLGNAVKYIARAGHKGERAEDLRKAQWYLSRAIANLEQGKAP